MTEQDKKKSLKDLEYTLRAALQSAYQGRIHHMDEALERTVENSVKE